MSIHLHRQISQLKKMVLTLSTMVEEQVHTALETVQNRDASLAARVRKADKAIDRFEVDVEEECLHTLALYQPVAFDLRFVVAVLKMNNDLERIGDLAVGIAQQGGFLAELGELDHLPYDLDTMGQRVQEMVRGALDAVVNIDADKAREVRKIDNEVDDIHEGMYHRMPGLMRENPHQIEQLVHLMNVSRQLERIADHAVNISKDVLYMAEGEIVRHAKTRRQHAQQQAAAAADTAA